MRQIDVDPNQRPFLINSNPSDEISIFQLKILIYGKIPAPYLSIPILHQFANDYEN